MVRHYYILVFLFFSYNYSIGQEFRGAEITYSYIGDSSAPHKYGITVKTCTKSSSSVFQFIYLEPGDGNTDSLPLIQSIPDSSGFDSQQNIYYGEHIYPGPGVYEIVFYGSNRVQGVINIPGSVNEPICVASSLVISPFFNANNSLQFNDYPCPAFACINEPFCYTLPATDPDGDSLSFELLPCAGEECDAIGGYQFPDFYGGVMTFDSLTGEFCWNATLIAGDYNILIKIHEWKNMGNGNYVEAGSVMRDMQIHVLSFCSMNIEEEKNNPFVSVYPNPVTDKLTLSTDFSSSVTFEIYNAIGEIVYTDSFRNTNSVDVSKWSNGIYFIRYSYGENTGCSKIVKE